jgi:pyruvate carboxylase
MFGDIVKVTPTSKVVGDMALMMLANTLTVSDVCNPRKEVTFPGTVVSLFKGALGFPPDGFPQELSRKILRTEPPDAYRPGDFIPDADLEAERQRGQSACEHPLDDRQLASCLMYPAQTAAFNAHMREYGDTSVLPTPAFLYGLKPQQEVSIDIAPGKTLLVSLQGQHAHTEDGMIKVQFELNGQSRSSLILKRAGADAKAETRKRPVADPSTRCI